MHYFSHTSLFASLALARIVCNFDFAHQEVVYGDLTLSSRYQSRTNIVVFEAVSCVSTACLAGDIRRSSKPLRCSELRCTPKHAGAVLPPHDVSFDVSAQLVSSQFPFHQFPAHQFAANCPAIFCGSTEVFANKSATDRAAAAGYVIIHDDNYDE